MASSVVGVTVKSVTCGALKMQDSARIEVEMVDNSSGVGGDGCRNTFAAGD